MDQECGHGKLAVCTLEVNHLAMVSLATIWAYDS